jgi:hypothetical protein
MSRHSGTVRSTMIMPFIRLNRFSKIPKLIHTQYTQRLPRQLINSHPIRSDIE